MSKNIFIKIAESETEFERLFEIRKEVFVIEQGVPLEHERDEFDGHAIHAIALLDGRMVATARAFSRPEAPGVGWIGRMAVERGARGKGIASDLLEFLVEWCRNAGFKRINLHAQAYVTELYRKHGFEPSGAPFTEEGIEHLEMTLQLKA